MADNDQKLAYFQEITGMTDTAVSHQILEAYDWDLDSAVQAMVDKESPINTVPEESMRVDANPVDAGPGTSLLAGPSGTPALGDDPMDLWPVNEQGFAVDDRSLFERIGDGEIRDRGVQAPDGTNWRVVTLPFVVLLGSYNLMYGVVGLGLLLAGGLLNAGLGMHA